MASTATSVAEHTLEAAPDGSLLLRFTFSADGVDVAALRMGQLELDVAADHVALRVAHDALRGPAADGDAERTGVQFRVALPHAVDPATAAAKFTRKGVPAPTLTIALTRAPGSVG